MSLLHLFHYGLQRMDCKHLLLQSIAFIKPFPLICIMRRSQAAGLTNANISHLVHDRVHELVLKKY